MGHIFVHKVEYRRRLDVRGRMIARLEEVKRDEIQPFAIARGKFTQRFFFLFGLLIAAVVAGAVLSPHFLQTSTVAYLLQYVPVLGVLGMAQTLVMLSGGPGIDLSLGAIMSLVGLAIAGLFGLGVPLILACVIGLGIGGSQQGRQALAGRDDTRGWA